MVRGEGSLARPSAALLADIKTVRGDRPITADDPLLWQHLFADAVTTIQESFPEAYSGSAIEDSGVWVSFAGKAPQGALDVLRKLPADVEVREDAGWTEADIRAMGEEIHHSTRALEGVADVSTSIDTNLGRIAVVTEVEAGTTAAAVRTESLAVASSVEGHRADTARSDLEGIAVEVTAVKADAGGFDALYGGAKLTTSSGGYCTAGFSVGSASYSQGLMTAAHCSDSLSGQVPGRGVALRRDLLLVRR